jgi:hypothetical protein
VENNIKRIKDAINFTKEKIRILLLPDRANNWKNVKIEKQIEKLNVNKKKTYLFILTLLYFWYTLIYSFLFY